MKLLRSLGIMPWLKLCIWYVLGYMKFVRDFYNCISLWDKNSDWRFGMFIYMGCIESEVKFMSVRLLDKWSWEIPLKLTIYYVMDYRKRTLTITGITCLFGEYLALMVKVKISWKLVQVRLLWFYLESEKFINDYGNLTVTLIWSKTSYEIRQEMIAKMFLLWYKSYDIS